MKLSSGETTTKIVQRFSLEDSELVLSYIKHSLQLDNSDYHNSITNILLYRLCMLNKKNLSARETFISLKYKELDKKHTNLFIRELFSDLVPSKIASYHGIPITMVQLLNASTFGFSRIKQNRYMENLK